MAESRSKTIRLIVLLAVVSSASAALWYTARMRLVPPPPGEAPAPVIEAIARFVSTEGNVGLKPVGSLEWNAARLEDPLRREDMVRTGAGGVADIRFFEGAHLHLRPESLITIEEGAQDPATRQRRVAWRISQGEAGFKTASRTLSVVSTPSLTAHPGEQADVSIQVARSGDVQMRVFQGKSQIVTSEGKTAEIASGEAISVDAKGTLGEKQLLLPMPPLSSPPGEALVSYPEPPRAATQLVWERVPGAVGYRVMVARDAAFADPIVDLAPVTTSSYVVRGLGLGNYWWRVAAIDRAGIEGRFSQARVLHVEASGGQGYGPPPPLRITDVATQRGILRVSGVTEEGARLSVNGISAGSVPGPTFDEFFILGPQLGPEIQIRSESINGGVTTVTRRAPSG